MSPIFVTLPAGSEIQVLQIVEDDWAMVLIDDQVGYIYIGSLENLDEGETAENPDEPEESENPDELETPEEEAVEEGPKKVLIFTSRRTVMTPGETVELTSILEGFENCETVNFQWECDQGEGFEPVEGANGDSWNFIADEQTLAWNWRLSVSYR